MVKNFTGIDSEYEKPEKAEISIDTSISSISEAVEQIVSYLELRGVLKN